MVYSLFEQLHTDKKQISVGFIGYPNVGKSSVINTLRSKKVCSVAPIAGETKVRPALSALFTSPYCISLEGDCLEHGGFYLLLLSKGYHWEFGLHIIVWSVTRVVSAHFGKTESSFWFVWHCVPLARCGKCRSHLSLF